MSTPGKVSIPLRIFLVGATGRNGRWILKAALEQGHHITALVRGDTNRLGVSHPALTLISGDLLQVSNLGALVAGHDVIISALDSQTVEAGTSKLIAAAQTGAVQRYIAIAGGGILQLDATRLRRERPDYPQRFLKSSEGHLRAWQELEASALNWTLLCTPDLLDLPASGKAVSRMNYMPEGNRSIPCGDVANFIMDELKSSRYPRTRVGLTTN